jgi:hypothetical protein
MDPKIIFCHCYPETTLLWCETASLESVRVKIGQPAGPVDDLEKLDEKKGKNTKAAIYWGGEIPEVIAMNFVPSQSFTDVISCDLDQPRGFQLAGPGKISSPIGNVHRAYTTALRKCAGM